MDVSNQSSDLNNQTNNVHNQNNYEVRNKKTLLSIVGVAILVIGLVGITYAIFNYTRTGGANTIRVGKIAFSSSQATPISLTNVFPISSTEALTDTTNTGQSVITITGDTEYSDGVEYLVTISDVHNTVGTGANQKTIPIAIQVTASNGLGSSNDNYFTNRGGNTSIYRVLSRGEIEENARVLVGYIAKGATGVNGTITIKAYLDSAKIAISDTYDGTESGNMGTTTDWVAGRTVLTTTEWNSLQTAGVSFKVKVEANEGIWVEESGIPLYDIITSETAPLDNVNSTNVQNVSNNNINGRVQFLDNVENQGKIIKLSAGIDFGAPSGSTNGSGLYIRSGTENNTYPIYYYRGNIYDNNVIFGGYCWLIVRTTDTGGIKLLYNGELDVEGTCMSSSSEATEEASEETGGFIRRQGYEVFLPGQLNSFAIDQDSQAYVGYMYGTVYEIENEDVEPGTYYGSGFTYNNGEYTLTNTKVDPDDSHHYTCNSTNANATCSEIWYVYYTLNSSTDIFYIEIADGKGIEQAIQEMETNTTNSNAKNVVDTWYAAHLTQYTNKLEDTVWCNDRSVSPTIAGTTQNMINYHGYWSPNGGIEFKSAFNRIEILHEPSLTCQQANDRFTVSSSNGNGALTYPIGLLTADELVLAGSIGDYAIGTSTAFINPWEAICTMTPGGLKSMYKLNDSGSLYNYVSDDFAGIRPAVSLKRGIEVRNNGADGTQGNPYIVN